MRRRSARRHMPTRDLAFAAVVPGEAPDSITTWMLRAVGMSKEHGLGIGEGQLRVFQPFFLTVDLPFSAIRGEEFPIKIALFNYLDSPQEIFVEIEGSDEFDLLDAPLKSTTIEANDIGGAQFMIRPKSLGVTPIKITARSTRMVDAVIKDLVVEPEGVEVEIVDNHVISDGHYHEFHPNLPFDAIDGSGRAYVALTGSFLTQTIEALDQLLRMPFGCGEQNMILFAPNMYIARYLKETGQLKPEIMAKAEHLMTVGYQRELTYRRADGSFSAFGDRDDEGSLWLTAFVLKTFAEAKALRAEFLGMVSHELRAPLTSIKGSAATVLGSSTDLDPAVVRQFFRIIEEQADHMHGLVADLLDVARIETGTLPVSPEPAEVAALVDRARSTFISAGGRNNLVIEFEPDLPLVMADRLRIVQVIGNLLSNAARHSPESSAIRVSAVREGLHVAFAVADEGRGIPYERLPFLFRKFTRIEGDERGSGFLGSGLGLAICKGIVEAHGGRIWAESEGPDMGAQFTFTLPSVEESGSGTASVPTPRSIPSSRRAVGEPVIFLSAYG